MTRKNNDTVLSACLVVSGVAIVSRYLHSGDTDYLLRDQIRLVLYYRVIYTRRKLNYREINVEIAWDVQRIDNRLLQVAAARWNKMPITCLLKPAYSTW